MSDTKQQNTVKYQWKKGDRFGEVVEVESKDGKFTNFTDGSKIFNNVLNEFLEKVEGNTLPFPGIDLTSSVAGVPAVATPVPVVKAPTPEPVQNTVEVKEPSIMGKMILKMSKKNIVNVPIQININIPTPQLYAMLSEGMEEEDLNQEITEVAMSQIEIEKLQDYVKDNVTDFLAKYYS